MMRVQKPPVNQVVQAPILCIDHRAFWSLFNYNYPSYNEKGSPIGLKKYPKDSKGIQVIRLIYGNKAEGPLYYCKSGFPQGFSVKIFPATNPVTSCVAEPGNDGSYPGAVCRRCGNL